MSMTIQPPIKNDQAVAQIAGKQTPAAQNSQLAPQTQSGIDKTGWADKADKGSGGKNDLSAAAATTAKDATDRLTALQGLKATAEIQVLAVLTSKTVDAKLESAQKQMNEITDSYPPFLRGSEERQKYLMSISSIRKQIEDMTIPPAGKLDSPAIDAAASKETKKMWAHLFQSVTVPPLEAGGPNEASDAQIRDASSTVSAMRSDLASRRDAVEQQVAPVGMSPIMAQYIGQTVGNILAQTGLSLTTNLTGVLKGL